MLKTRCVACRTTLKGYFHTLTSKSSPLSLSEADIESFDITNLGFECGNEGCGTVVCHRCIAELERRKEGRFLSKREHLICPQCKKPFGEGGAHFMVEGRFPPNVTTNRVRAEVQSGRGMKWDFSYSKLKYAGGPDLRIPTSTCCVCMSDSVFRVIQIPLQQLNPMNLRQHYVLRHTFPYCKGCLALLTHPSVASPRLPYRIHLSNPGSSWGMVTFMCANPDYLDLVRALNHHLFQMP